MKSTAELSRRTRNGILFGVAILGLLLLYSASGQRPPEPHSSGTHAEAAARVEASEHAAAVRWLRRALEQDPSDADALLSLGWVHVATGDFREAVGTFSEAVELRPNSPECLGGSAAAHAYLQDYEAARRDLAAAIHLNPGDAGVSLLQDDGDPSKAKRLEEKQLWHGRAQLAELVNDRPEVSSVSG